MPDRTITIGETVWRVSPSGLVTQNNRDEFGLFFTHGIADERKLRVTRYSPLGARSREQSFAELSDAELVTLFHQSQPSSTSPEARDAR
jgi:hypothetical protein